MKYTVRPFGIVRDILGGREVEIEISGNSVADLRTFLLTRYPEMSGLHSLFIAVNQQYAADSVLLRETDEIALIPPVSGG